MLRDVQLLCPCCHAGPLEQPDRTQWICTNSECARAFPVVAGRPVLLCEERSVFSFDDYRHKADMIPDHDPSPGGHGLSMAQKAKKWLKKIVPTKSLSISDFSASEALQEVARQKPNGRVLVVGAGDVQFEGHDSIDITYSDVVITAITDLIADAHDLPFPDEYFDAVLAVAVLEHVADPYRVESEMRRVLTRTGWIYVVTPFMQQVHMGRYDFTRFTAVGHRRLLHHFDELRSGVATGPGMALLWAQEFFIRSLIRNATLATVAAYAVRLTMFWIKYLDYYTAKSPVAYDAASSFYFFGQKRDVSLSDRDIIAQYKGSQTN